MRFSQLKLSVKLAILVLTSFAGSLLFALVVYSTLTRVKVGGPFYQEISLGKDLIADVLPPPEYVIETYLLMHEASRAVAPAELAEITERGQRLRRDYQARHEY